MFDITDLLPMTCTTCGHECANRIESFFHTEATGHERFHQVKFGVGNATGEGRHDRTPQPMKCRTCGYHCANRAESWEHTEATGHTGFRQERSVGSSLKELVDLLQDARPGHDDLTPQPMHCKTCGFQCANRAESWVHTEETGHSSFTRGYGCFGMDDKTPNPMTCSACGFQCANRAESWSHTEATGHSEFTRIETIGLLEALLPMALLNKALKPLVLLKKLESAIGDDSGSPCEAEEGGARMLFHQTSPDAAGTIMRLQRIQASCRKATPQEWELVEKQFRDNWTTGNPPTVREIYEIQASAQVEQNYRRKCDQIGLVERAWRHGDPHANQQLRFHGTNMVCNFAGSVCGQRGCAICSIICSGFQIKQHLGRNTQNRGNFGEGGYLTSLSSTAFGYGNRKGMLLVQVAVGSPDIVTDFTSAGLPSGTHSRLAIKPSGVDELMIPDDHQLLPRYLLLF